MESATGHLGQRRIETGRLGYGVSWYWRRISLMFMVVCRLSKRGRLSDAVDLKEVVRQQQHLMWCLIYFGVCAARAKHNGTIHHIALVLIAGKSQFKCFWSKHCEAFVPGHFLLTRSSRSNLPTGDPYMVRGFKNNEVAPAAPSVNLHLALCSQNLLHFS